MIKIGNYTYHTEREQINNNQHQIFRLAKLYDQNLDEFMNICSYLPFPTYINDIDTLDLTLANNTLSDQMECSQEQIIEEGHGLIKKISDPSALKNSIDRIRKFQAVGDRNAVCSYVQRLVLNKQMTWSFTYKVFIDSDLFLNTMHHFEGFGRLGTVIENILGESFVKRDGWQAFNSLSKREKEIMKLLAEGLTSRQISDQLFISKFTVDTHRRNIFQKLQVKTYSDLFKIVQAFDLVKPSC